MSKHDLQFFVYPFSDKEVATIPINLNESSESFGFILNDDELMERTYVKELNNTVKSSAAKSFGNIKSSRQKLRGSYITHINGDPVFTTSQALEKLKSIYHEFKSPRIRG